MVGQLSSYRSASLAQTGGAELIASGGASSMFSLSVYESRLPEGDVARLDINMRLIPPGAVSTIQRLLDLQPGLELAAPVTTAPGRVIVIKVKKSLGPLLALAVVLAIFFVGAILLLVTSWALFRELPSTSLFNIDPKLLLAIGAVVVGVVVIGGRRATP